MLTDRRTILKGTLALPFITVTGQPAMANIYNVIDAFDRPHPTASNGNDWELVSDTVMGGVSNGTITRRQVNDRTAVQMQGDVRLENNGGFIQMALDLGPNQGAIDASRWDGIAINVLGNTQEYNIHLRTTDIKRPWQSYRQSFTAKADWQTLKLPFANFTNHRIDAPLDLTGLRRIGIVAIGRAFRADIALSDIRLYKDTA